MSLQSSFQAETDFKANSSNPQLQHMNPMMENPSTIPNNSNTSEMHNYYYSNNIPPEPMPHQQPFNPYPTIPEVPASGGQDLLYPPPPMPAIQNPNQPYVNPDPIYQPPMNQQISHVFDPINMPITQPPFQSPLNGQKVSCSATGNQLWIELLNMSNCGYYVGGDTISGRIVLQCSIPFHCQSIQLNIKGVEKVKFYKVEQIETPQKQKKNELIKYKDTTDIFKPAPILYPMGGQLGAGFYSFPFDISLPINLPGTIIEKEGSKDRDGYYHIKISYQMSATVHSTRENAIVYSCPIVINQKYSQPIQSQTLSDTKKFINGDMLDAKFILNRGVFFPGEEVLATLEARTNTAKECRKIQFKIERTVGLTVDQKKFYRSSTVFTSVHDGFWPCFYGVRKMRFFIPNSLRVSISSPHISIQYSIRLICDFPLAIDFDVKMPLLLISPQYLLAESPPLPPPDQTPHTISFRAKWQDGDRCMKCGKGFNLFVRKHHCRHCGRLLCDGCTSNRVKMPNIGFDTAERVCLDCLEDARNGGLKKHSILLNPQQPPRH